MRPRLTSPLGSGGEVRERWKEGRGKGREGEGRRDESEGVKVG